jgi:hypothetical protein
MPTKRRKTAARRIGIITTALRAHLICGHYFLADSEADRFVDDEHRRSTWEAWREQCLDEWDHPGRRPAAMWEYDYQLRRCGSCREWTWPRPIQTEAEMVYRLLKAGELAPCRFNGLVRIESELEWIEATWLKEIGQNVGYSDTLPKISLPLTTWGTPGWFWRKHARRILAELNAERAKYRASLERLAK